MAFEVTDAAKTHDPVEDAPTLIDTLTRQFAEVRDCIPAEAWLLTHRLMNALRANTEGNKNVVENSVQQVAIGEEPAGRVRMVVSGHRPWTSVGFALHNLSWARAATN